MSAVDIRGRPNVSTHNPRRIGPQLKVIALYRFGPFACESPRLIPLKSFLILGPDVCVDSPRVNVAPCCGQENRSRDDVLERSRCET